MKRFLVLIVLTGFISGAFLSISAMNHNQGVAMNRDCPTSPLHVGVCPISDLPVASHYLSMYQDYTNVIVSYVITQVLMIVILFVVVSYVFCKNSVSIQHLFILSRALVAKLYRPQAFTRWLSLLVNSPSLI